MRSLRSVENLDKSQKSESACGNAGIKWNVLMNVKVIVAILLVAALPVYAQGQSATVPRVSKGDAEKVVKIISGDKAKTQTYCDMDKLASQIEEASAKKDNNGRGIVPESYCTGKNTWSRISSIARWLSGHRG